jgi:hypothetical protein
MLRGQQMRVESKDVCAQKKGKKEEDEYVIVDE